MPTKNLQYTWGTLTHTMLKFCFFFTIMCGILRKQLTLTHTCTHIDNANKLPAPVASMISIELWSLMDSPPYM